MDKINLSIVIPAYNEEKTIENTIYSINGYLKNKNFNYEIIVVDDGSKDKTSLKVQEISKNITVVRLVSYKPNKGKGEAIQQGIFAAKGNLILFSDADLSTPISELEKLIPWIKEGYDIIIGSRRVQTSNITKKQPFHRRLSGKIFQWMIRVVLHLPFSDTQCGFKLFKGSVAKELFSKLKHKGFVFDVEIIYKAYISGYKIAEVGVLWANDPTSTVRFFRDSMKCFVDLWKIRFHC